MTSRAVMAAFQLFKRVISRVRSPLRSLTFRMGCRDCEEKKMSPDPKASPKQHAQFPVLYLRKVIFKEKLRKDNSRDTEVLLYLSLELYHFAINSLNIGPFFRMTMLITKG